MNSAQNTPHIDLGQTESEAYITSLTVHADENASAINAYWRANAEFSDTCLSILLVSDSNDSFYTKSRPDVFRNSAATLFDVGAMKGITPIDDAVIEVKFWSYGKQSSKRYMNPKNEGYLRVEVHTSGVNIDGFSWMKKLSFKLFICGGNSEQLALDTLTSVMSEKLCKELKVYLEKTNAGLAAKKAEMKQGIPS